MQDRIADADVRMITRRSFVAGAVSCAVTPAFAMTYPRRGTLHLKPDREQMITVPGGRIYVRINGNLDGVKPPIVFIHGGPGSSHWYFLNATSLADERAVILYDQLDSGRSDHPGNPANWTVSRFVSELEAMRTVLGIKRWHALGASWGSTVGLEYAVQYPRVVASVILQSPLISTPIWLRDARLLKDTMPPNERQLLYACDTPGVLPKARCDAATDAFYARYVQRADAPPAIAAYKASLPRSFSPDVYEYMWGRAEFTATGTLKDYDGTPLLKRLDGRRTLFVAGEFDEAIPTTIEAFARSVPGATFRQIPSAAHTVMIDNPATYLSVLRPWLDEHDPT